MFVIFGASSSAMTAAYRAADMGEDVTILEPTHRKWYMWNSGLVQTDRESTFIATPKNSLRWGALTEFQRRANIFAGLVATSDNLFFTAEGVSSVMDGMMADFASARAGKGVIKVITNAGLQYVDQDVQTNVIRFIRCGGVDYPGMNFHDATDEGDLAAAAGCMLSYGRESALGTMDSTSGVRGPGSGGLTTVRAANLTTGRRRKKISARSSKSVGDADLKLMAFNMRLIFTDHADRIKWADVVVPDYDPANYDYAFDYAMSVAFSEIPASISNSPMKATGGIPQYDANNGGLVKFGSNRINEFLKWFSMHAWDRIAYTGEYTVDKAGLFKDIATNPRWLNIPRNATTGKQIVEETNKWGLVPGVFVEAAWTPNASVTVGTVVANGSNLYLCTRAGTTAAAGGPTGKNTAILDGSGVAGAVWRWLRYYVPGMSPHIYVREGRRIVGETDQQYDDVTTPEHDILEPVTAYGYPHADAHWVNIYANELGLVNYEGGSGLAGEESPNVTREIVAAIMPWGALKANYADCPNLTVSRATSGTKQGWLVSRLEMCYMKFGDVCGMAAAVCKIKMLAANDNKPVYTGDLVYKTDLQDRLIAAGAPLTLPKAA